MFEKIRELTLRFLRVPPEPQPPAGAPGSVRVFRAGRNYFSLKVAGWVIAQLTALAGALISLWFVGGLVDRTWEMKRTAPPPSATVAPADAGPTGNQAAAPATAPPPDTKAKAKPKAPRRSATRQLAVQTPDWVLIAIRLFEYGALALFLLQIPWTFAALRLDYEMRWYVVTDRSLRIRRGLLTVEESTLSFVNIQQVVVSQGPLQRLLGLADVRVQSAGGGGGPHGHDGGDTLHTAVFHAVDNAHDLRDLILNRLRQFRAASLGDPDDTVKPHSLLSSAPVPSTSPAPSTHSADTLAAAQDLLSAARELRAAL